MYCYALRGHFVNVDFRAWPGCEAKSLASAEVGVLFEKSCANFVVCASS